MTTSDCPRTTLVEAFRDGRLGPQECASLERHLEGCAVCTACARDLEKIGNAVRAPREPLTPLEHQRARVALLQKAASPAPAQKQSPPISTLGASERLRSSSPLPTLAFGLVFAAAAMMVGFFWGSGNHTRYQAMAWHLGALPRLNVRGTESPDKLGFLPSDDARFARNRTADLDELTLDHGVIEVKLPKLESGKRFVVRTKDALIEVRATAFRVEAEEGKIRSVAVEQGTVEVQYAGFTAVIPAGGSWRATPTSAANPPANSAPEVATPPALETPPPPSPVVVATNAPRTPTRNVVLPAMDHSDKHDSVREVVDPSPGVVVPSPAPSPDQTTKRPDLSAASQTFADAMAALRSGDYAAGAEKLERFSQTHGSDARADEADYLRAIALQRAGKHDEARAAAKRYLATRPNGAHRANATRIATNQ